MARQYVGSDVLIRDGWISPVSDGAIHAAVVTHLNLSFNVTHWCID